MDAGHRSNTAWTGTPWPGVLDDVVASAQMQALRDFVASERTAGPIYPAPDDVFRAFELTPFQSVRVVLLGQDPYPNPGQAMGLSFSVPRKVDRLPRSLCNIHVAMALEGMESPSHGDLTGWAEQGVLMLNAALTVRAKDAASHLRDWRPFTHAVIRRLAAREAPVVFVAWGVKAQQVLQRGLADSGSSIVVSAPHPAARGTAQTLWRTSATFTRINEHVSALGQEPIDWSRH